MNRYTKQFDETKYMSLSIKDEKLYIYIYIYMYILCINYFIYKYILKSGI